MSPPGNLYASTIVRPMAGDPPAHTLALVAAVALDQLLRAYIDPGRVMIKWPNDLLVDGAKISGILLEAIDDAVVVGIGVNLAHHPEGLDRVTTSLAAAAGTAPDPADFVEDLAESFAHWLRRWRSERLPAVLQQWRQRAHPIGTALTAGLPDGSRIDGVFDGLDDDGTLRLRLGDGMIHHVHAGDVFLL